MSKFCEIIEVPSGFWAKVIHYIGGNPHIEEETSIFDTKEEVERYLEKEYPGYEILSEVCQRNKNKLQ